MYMHVLGIMIINDNNQKCMVTLLHIYTYIHIYIYIYIYMSLSLSIYIILYLYIKTHLVIYRP